MANRLAYKSHREIWIQEHGWTLLLACIREAWDLPANERRAWAQAGWERRRGHTEVLLGVKQLVELSLLYVAVLLPCRRDIFEGRATPLMRSTSFLHREYERGYFWWEPIFLMQRLTISGWLQLIDDPFQRILAALVLCIVYLALLLGTQPYKRRDLDFLSTGCQGALVCIYLGGALMRLYQDLEAEGGTELAAMSTTCDLRVAIEYAASASSVLLRICTSTVMQRGADLAFLSAFPNEAESARAATRIERLPRIKARACRD